MDATRIVGPGRSGGWKAALFGMALSGLGCSPTANLGSIGDGGASLLWKATFEPGNLSEWTGDGQGNTVYTNKLLVPVATSAVFGHNGSKWAGFFSVNPPGGMLSESYLCRSEPNPQPAYYSAWYYVPSSVYVESYLSLWHWREISGGNTDSPVPMWDVNLTQPTPGTLYAQLYDFNDQIDTPQVVAKFPTDQWVQLEVFVSKSTAKKGRVTVWQNGTLILDVQDVQTILNASDPLQWCVGGASTALAPPLPIHLYVDDAAISTVQLGPNVVF